MDFFKDNKVTVLDWPGNSPDISPIENLWAIMKKRLHNHDCTQKTKLIETVIKVWFHDDEIKAMCQNLVNSMPDRVRHVITAKGGHTKY